MKSVEALIKSLTEHPEEWTFGQYSADHKSGVRVWTGNGFFFLGFYHPCEWSFSLIDKFRVERALTICKDKKVLMQFGYL